MARAWDWYRITLRGSRLVARNGSVIGYLVGIATYAACQTRINSWAADPRVDADLLKRALDDVHAINAMTPKTSDCMKVEYLCAMKMAREPQRFIDHFYNDPWMAHQSDLKNWTYHLPGYWRVRWFFENDPELTRRSVQLVSANWLSQCDLPPEQRARLIGSKTSSSQMLYDVKPPDGALGPVALIERIESSALANTVLPSYVPASKAFDRHLRQRAGLVMFLADKLYERKYGKPANCHDDLIGTCLERFPEGYVRPRDSEEPVSQ
jgi:hypothetical protein